jgi:hypothetical protein
MRTIFLVILGCILTSFHSDGLKTLNDVKAELKKINSAYENVSMLSENVNYILYADHKSQKVLESQQGYSRKKGSLYHLKYGQLEKVSSANANLILDHENMYVVVDKRRTTKRAYQIENLDSLLNTYSEISLSESGTENRIISVKYAESNIAAIHVYYGKKSFLINRIIIYYSKSTPNQKVNTPPRVEITYTDISTKPQFSTDEFSTDKIVTKINGKYVLRPKYQKYTLLTYN